MYTLFRGLWKYIFQKDEYFLLIVGLDNAGKTTLFEHIKQKFALRTYNGIAFEKIAPTVGMNMGKIHVGNEVIVLWDLGGQTELQSLWSKYFLDCHGVLYVIDSSDLDRLEESRTSFSNLISDQQLEGVPILLVANKQDKQNILDVEKIRETFNESVLQMGHRDWKLHETSALDGDGVVDAIHWIVKCMKKNFDRPPKPKDIV